MCKKHHENLEREYSVESAKPFCVIEYLAWGRVIYAVQDTRTGREIARCDALIGAHNIAALLNQLAALYKNPLRLVP